MKRDLGASIIDSANPSNVGMTPGGGGGAQFAGNDASSGSVALAEPALSAADDSSRGGYKGSYQSA